MSLSELFIILPIFMLLYQGLGYVFEARERQASGQNADPGGPAPQKALRDFASMSAKLGFNKMLLRSQRLSQRLDLLLLRSGYPFGWNANDLLFYKELLAALGMVLLWICNVTDYIFYPLAAIAGFILPDLYLQTKIKARQAVIQRNLPGFIDLTALTIESGLDLMTAVERILEKMKPNSLREELFTLLQENRLGTPRKEALQNLAYRVNLPDVQALTSLIIQSEELGTGLASVLRTFADDIRNKRILRAEETAGKAPVKLLFPMMVFFFPIVFIIIFGPLALNFLTSYK